MIDHPREALPALIDGELDGRRRSQVEDHLSSCAECSAELSRLRALSGIMRALPQNSLPPGFMQRLQRRRSAADGPARRALLPAPARLVAFALSSLIVSLVVYDKVRLNYPVTGGTPTFTADRSDSRLPSAALSSSDLDQARQAKGKPLFGAVSKLERKGPSNEELQEHLEKQKKLMGIRSITPMRSPEEQARLQLSAAGSSAERLDAAAPMPTLPNAASAPAQLKSEPEKQAAAASPPLAAERGAPLLEPEAPAALSAEAVAEGLVLNSEEERRQAWADRNMHLTPPSVNYTLNMLVVVVAPDMRSAVEVLGVQTFSDRLSVRYRLFPRIEALAGAAKRAGTPVRSYQFRVVPKTDKSVSFDRVE